MLAWPEAYRGPTDAAPATPRGKVPRANTEVTFGCHIILVVSLLLLLCVLVLLLLLLLLLVVVVVVVGILVLMGRSRGQAQK